MSFSDSVILTVVITILYCAAMYFAFRFWQAVGKQDHRQARGVESACGKLHASYFGDWTVVTDEGKKIVLDGVDGLLSGAARRGARVEIYVFPPDETP